MLGHVADYRSDGGRPSATRYLWRSLRCQGIIQCICDVNGNPGSLDMPGFSRITSDPEIMNGQPCIRGLRLTVRRVLEALATYPDRKELHAEYPELEDEDVRQALAYAAASLDDKVLELHEA